MKTHLLFLIFIFSYQVYGQQPTASVKPSVVQENQLANADADSRKKALIKEFEEALGVPVEIDMAIQGASSYLNQMPKEKDPLVIEQNKKIYAAAKVKWEQRKKSLAPELADPISKEFSNSFSEADLRYLVEFSRSTLFKKYKKMIESDIYLKHNMRPYEIARELLNESKNDLSAKAAPKAVPKVK